jgi:MFS family permease
MNDDDMRRELLARIETRRAGVTQFLSRSRPAIRRRSNATMTLSSLAAVFTAGPAIGGENFSGWMQKIFGLASDSYVWRSLCLLALLVSLGAAVMSNLSKSHEETINRLSTAEATKGELEGLATLVQFGHLSVEEAVRLFHQYSVKIPFVDETSAVAAQEAGR